jgi:four helix bundle protein
MQDFKKLTIWQKAHSMTIAVYQATEAFPMLEQYGLTSQIRRACVSIPANIAEGCGRDGSIEFGRFLQIAMGSVYELEYLIILARDLKYINGQDFEVLNNQLSEIRKMLIAFKPKLKGEKVSF